MIGSDAYLILMDSSGRPTVINDEVVRKLEAALQHGFSVSEACLVSGISRATFYEHKASNGAFSDKMELARKYVTIRAKKVVAQAVNDGNLSAARWWLERRARDEFGANALDEDARWEAQNKTDEADDPLKQMLDTMKLFAEKAIADTATTY